MLPEKYVISEIEKLQGSGKTFAEFLAVIFKDKFIEIYVGDAYEDLSTEQVNTSYPAVFCGKVVAAYRECLIINAASIDLSHHVHLGNMMFINERAIRALNEIDGNGNLEDMMLRSKEAMDIKAALVDPHQSKPKPKK
jgi:hypothetical protein